MNATRAELLRLVRCKACKCVIPWNDLARHRAPIGFIADFCNGRIRGVLSFEEVSAEWRR